MVVGRTVSKRPTGSVSYEDFRQRVRRYRQDDVLSGVARIGAQIERVRIGHDAARLPNFVTPFTLGGVARTAIIAANNHRTAKLTEQALLNLCASYTEILDPDLLCPSADLRPILTRIAYEQFSSGYSPMENIGRVHSLLIDGLGRTPNLPTREAWREKLGVSLEQFARVGFAMNTAALSNEGCIDRSVLLMDHVAPIFHPLAPEDALALVDRWFAGSLPVLAQNGRRAARPGLETLSFNPLREKPIIAMLDGQYLMPWPRLIIDRFTMPGLYFIGLRSFGKAFTRALGHRFECYVGEQLAQLEAARVEPEITYGKPEQKTVDFFLVTDEVVVLVEAKASRPIEPARQGLSDGDADTIKKIGKAFKQIEATASLLRDSHPELAHIPLSGRQLCGLVVTAEPFQLVNSTPYDAVLDRPSIPTTVVCSHDLERFVGRVAGSADIGPILVDALVEHAHRWMTLDEAAGKLPMSANSLLVDAYNKLLDIDSDN